MRWTREWMRSLRERFALELRILRFRWWMSWGRGDDAVGVLRGLDLPGRMGPGRDEKRLAQQYRRWGRYLRHGTLAPLTSWGLLLEPVKLMAIAAVALSLFIAALSWPELSRWLPARAERVRRFPQTGDEASYFVWWPGLPAEACWMTQEQFDLFRSKMAATSRKPATPPVVTTEPIAEGGWEELPDAGTKEVPADTAVRQRPTREAGVLFRAGRTNAFRWTGNVVAADESLWIGVVIMASDGRVAEGWIEGKPSPAAVVAPGGDSSDPQRRVMQLRLEGGRTLRKTARAANGNVVRKLVKDEVLVLAGRGRWGDKFIWLSCRVEKDGETEEGWVGFDFEFRPPEVVPPPSERGAQAVEEES